LKTITTNLRGCFAFFVIGLNTALGALPIFFIAILKFIIPIDAWRLICSHMLNQIVEFWVHCNDLWLPAPEKVFWKDLDPDRLDQKRSYLVTSNHQTWADIFLVQHLLNGRAPQIKFFLKQELIWIPVIGLCWWALDYPFMKRYSKSYLKKHPGKKGVDQQTTIKACQKFRSVPVSIYNFMEGTRFTPEKQARQKSPYKHLLKPKAGGAGFVLSALGEEIDSILNLTIYYHDAVPGYWDLLCGKNGGVEIRVEEKKIPENLQNRDYSTDNSYRKELLTWVNELWEEKDQLLIKLNGANENKSTTTSDEKTTAGDENPEAAEQDSAEKKET